METKDTWVVDWKYVAEELAKEIADKDMRYAKAAAEIASLRSEVTRLKQQLRTEAIHEAETRRGSHIRKAVANEVR